MASAKQMFKAQKQALTYIDVNIVTQTACFFVSVRQPLILVSSTNIVNYYQQV